MQRDKRPSHAASHEYCWDALPWYQNGSLEAGELESVHAHVNECLTCTRELRRLQRLARVIAAPTTEHASAQAFSRLTRRIEAQAQWSSTWPGRLALALRAVFVPWPLVSGSAVLLLSVLVSAIVLNGDDEPANNDQPFQTAGPGPARVSEISQPLMRVVLQDDLGEVGLTRWLERHQAEVVAGPTAIGVLTVRVNAGHRSTADALNEIRADAQTLFVEPVDFVGARPDRRR